MSETSDAPAVRWPADQVERWPIERLIPYARNARTHTEAQVAQIAASMREWGWTIPVLIDDVGNVLAGHGRLLAARVLELTEIPVVIARDWTEAQKRAYIVADNKLSLNADWDHELLSIELDELRSLNFDLGLTGFDARELDVILGATALPEQTDYDESAADQVKYVECPYCQQKFPK